MITVSTLRAAGLTEEQIAVVVEIAARQRVLKRREANRKRQQRLRAARREATR